MNMGSGLLQTDGQRMCMVKTCLIDISEDNDLSTVVDLEGLAILGLIVPICNNTPNLTFTVSPTAAGTFVNLKEDDGSTAAITVVGGAAAFAVGSDELTQLAGYRFVKIAASVAQTADRTFTWVLKA